MRWLLFFILCMSVTFACTEYYYGSLCESCSSTTMFLIDNNVYGQDVHTNSEALSDLKLKFRDHDIPPNGVGLPILFQNGMYFTGSAAIKEYFNTSTTGNCSIIEAGVVSLAEPVNPSAYVTLSWYMKQLSSHMFFFVGILLIFVGTSFIMPVQQSSYRLMQEYAILAPVLGIAITIPSWNWLFILFIPALLSAWYMIHHYGIHLSYHLYLVGALTFIATLSANTNQFSYAMPSFRLLVYNLVTMTVLMITTYAVHEFIISGKNEEDLIAEQVHLQHIGASILTISIMLLTQSL